MSAADLLNRIWPASGDHHRLPEEIPADASNRTEMFTVIKVAPLPVPDQCHLMPRFIPHREPKPFTSTPRLDRDVLAEMRRDFDGLPIFRKVAKDKYEVQRLAMRIPINDEGKAA